MQVDSTNAIRGSITILIHQLQRGRRDVMQELFEVYFLRLEALCRSWLNAGHRRVADEGDLAIEVLTSFLLTVADGELPELRSREDVWRLLAKRLKLRAINHTRDATRERREIESHRIGSARMSPEALSGITGVEQLESREPNPLEQVIQDEELNRLAKLHEKLIGCLLHPKLKQIATLVLEGVSPELIGERVNLSRASVYRKLALIKGRWRVIDISYE